MNNQKKMGNVSRVSDQIKKKLEVSFSSDDLSAQDVNANSGKSAHTEVNKLVNMEVGKSINTEVGKLVIPDSSIYGKGDFNDISIHTEIQKTSQQESNRFKKVAPRTPGQAKSKATFCLDTIASEQLDAIYIKRLSSKQKSNRSALICEAISLLFEKEKLVD